jgi:hypothetical protein
MSTPFPTKAPSQQTLAHASTTSRRDAADAQPTRSHLMHASRSQQPSLLANSLQHMLLNNAIASSKKQRQTGINGSNSINSKEDKTPKC